MNPRMASAFEIMRDGPLGAAGFNNEFGRPCLAGYFRTFELETGTPGIVLRDADTIIQANAEQVVSIPIVVSGPDTIGGRHALRFQIESTDGTTRKTVESSYFGPL